MTPQRGEHHLLLTWLVFAGLLLFALFVTWHQGWMAMLYSGDRSGISWVITLLFLLVTLHAARRMVFLSGQIDASGSVRNALQSPGPAPIRLEDGKIRLGDGGRLPDCLLSDFLGEVIHQSGSGIAANAAAGSDNGELIEVYRSRLKSPHELGWFASDIMIKLGLLGTIVGFVLMLGSVLNVTDFDAATMQGVLKNMSSGMGTALYTTFAGLVCSMLTSAQYYLLDRGADELLETARHLSQTRVLPQLARQPVAFDA